MDNSLPHSLKVLVPGTVLLDTYEATGESHLGGAEFNFAYHVQNLIGGVDFIARVGNDEAGKRIRQELARRKFPTRFLQTDPGHPTKTVRVVLTKRHGPRFLIPSGTASEFLESPVLPAPSLDDYAMIYFGTTLQHGEISRRTLRSLVERFPGPKFCDLNLRPPHYTRDVVEYSLHHCDVLKVNQEELDVLAQYFALTGTEESQVAALALLFGLSSVCLTRGGDGSLLWQGEQFTSHRLEHFPVVDTVGAGDAFSACLAIGLLKGWPAPRILEFASSLAGAICRIQGAVPADNLFYAPYRSML